MKSKKLNKKLILNRKTISNLNGSDMEKLNGRGDVPGTSNPCLETDPCVCPTQYTHCGTCAPSNCQTACPLICK